MDPDANLTEQAYLLHYGPSLDAIGRLRLAELRRALRDWLSNGGFQPNWEISAGATRSFWSWRGHGRAIQRRRA